MISLLIKDFNTLDKVISSDDLQVHYNKVIKHYDYLIFKCPKCNSSNWHIHGYYKRKIILYGFTYEINVTRVKCACCSVTHVILPSFIIPFNLKSVKDIILNVKVNMNNLFRLIITKARKLSLIFLYPT